MFFNNSLYISPHGAAINFLDIFPFLLIRTFLLISSISLCSFRWFLVLFWMLWMLVTVFRLWHVPHESRITTSRILFTERFLTVSKMWVRSCSHASLIIYIKTVSKKLNAVRPKSCHEGEKEKETQFKALCAKAQTQLKLLLMYSLLSLPKTIYLNHLACFSWQDSALAISKDFSSIRGQNVRIMSAIKGKYIRPRFWVVLSCLRFFDQPTTVVVWR